MSAHGCTVPPSVYPWLYCDPLCLCLCLCGRTNWTISGRITHSHCFHTTLPFVVLLNF